MPRVWLEVGGRKFSVGVISFPASFSGLVPDRPSDTEERHPVYLHTDLSDEDGGMYLVGSVTTSAFRLNKNSSLAKSLEPLLSEQVGPEAVKIASVLYVHAG